MIVLGVVICDCLVCDGLIWFKVISTINELFMEQHNTNDFFFTSWRLMAYVTSLHDLSTIYSIGLQ